MKKGMAAKTNGVGGKYQVVIRINMLKYNTLYSGLITETKFHCVSPKRGVVLFR
jgi:hypothetical protein